MTFLEDRDFSDVPLIPKYFEGKTIFVTGGTGFIGKILIEKLLYTCTKLNKIFILMRNKKGVKSEDRLAALYEIPCFDRLRKERPGVFESKVQFIAGDMSEDFLGISEDDRVLIVNTTNIVFHVAASVRFNDYLETAVKLNLQGTKEVIDLAKDMRNLESFVHVSTSFSNTMTGSIKEQLYPPVADWRDLIEICKNFDSHTLHTLTPKFIDGNTNTYVFTKQLAEHMVYEERGRLPIVICRPSIVASSIKEPFPGWIDNFNGPVGLLIAGGKGVVHSFYTDPKIKLDIIPVDWSVKGLIVAAWTRGTKRLEPTDDIPIYNNCIGDNNNFTYGELQIMGFNIVTKIPFSNAIWNNRCQMTTNVFKHFPVVLLMQIIPAIIIDLILRIVGRKPMMIKIQRRLFMVHIALYQYVTQQWEFCVKNFLELHSTIKDGDRNEFSYVDNYDKYEYYENAIIGGKRYLLKEKDEDLPKMRAHFTRLGYLDKFTKAVFFGCILWWALKKTCSLFELNCF